jgi:hypothetical protein
MHTLFAVRRMLGAILLLGMTGTGVELFLMGHYEDFEQLIPVVLLGTGIVTVGWHFVAGSPASGTVVKAVMVLFVAAGLTGVYYHLAANLEFQQETDPTLRGSALFWKALHATVPPALAPGVMVQLGLVGLAYTYRHKER